MKKFSLALLTTVLFTASGAQALPVKAAGAGGNIEIENSRIRNIAEVNNSRNVDICQAGGLCTAGSGANISATVGQVKITNTTINNTAKLNNSRNMAVCQSGGACTAAR